METDSGTQAAERPIEQLPVVGNNLALDYANTVDDPDGPTRHDYIASYQGLLAWSVAAGVLTDADAGTLRRRAASHPVDAAAALRQAHALRRVLGALFTDVADGVSASPHWPSLQPFVLDAVAHAELAPRGDGHRDDPDAPAAHHGYHWQWHGSGAAHAMLWPVAHAAAELLTAPELARVKRCGGCPWVFVDTSRNGSRRWCTMEACGTHAKIVRYVARRAARREQAAPGRA